MNAATERDEERSALDAHDELTLTLKGAAGIAEMMNRAALANEPNGRDDLAADAAFALRKLIQKAHDLADEVWDLREAKRTAGVGEAQS